MQAAPPVESHAAPRSNRRYLLDSERFLGTAMLLPAVLYILVLVGIPFVLAILYSFSDATVGSPQIDRLTLDSFNAVLRDPVFGVAVSNTFLFSFGSQIVTVILANLLAPALLLNFRGKWFVRLLILLPWATPIAVTTIMWLWMVDPVYSPLDWVLRQSGLLGPGRPLGIGPSMYWVSGSAGLARFTVIMINVWRTLPLATVILMAGLTSIPSDIKDAVAVDGVGFWREYTQVTLPLLRPVLLVAFLFGVIFTFTDMTVINVVTRGQPINSTQVLASWAYYRGIPGSNLAQGAATAIFMLPVLLGIALVMLRIARRSDAQ